MKILKFGGKSLTYGNGFEKTIEIILDKVNNNEKIAVVVSAIANATDELEEILEKAVKSVPYLKEFSDFKNYQQANFLVDLSEEFRLLEKTFEGVALLGDYSNKIKDNVLAYKTKDLSLTPEDKAIGVAKPNLDQSIETFTKNNLESTAYLTSLNDSLSKVPADQLKLKFAKDAINVATAGYTKERDIKLTNLEKGKELGELFNNFRKDIFGYDNEEENIQSLHETVESRIGDSTVNVTSHLSISKLTTEWMNGPLSYLLAIIDNSGACIISSSNNKIFGFKNSKTISRQINDRQV